MMDSKEMKSAALFGAAAAVNAAARDAVRAWCALNGPCQIDREMAWLERVIQEMDRLAER